jgi:hypothetical protein
MTLMAIVLLLTVSTAGCPEWCTSEEQCEETCFALPGEYAIASDVVPFSTTCDDGSVDRILVGASVEIVVPEGALCGEFTAQEALADSRGCSGTTTVIFTVGSDGLENIQQMLFDYTCEDGRTCSTLPRDDTEEPEDPPSDEPPAALEP